MQNYISFPAISKTLVVSGVLFFLLIYSPTSALAQSEELPERPDTQELLPETTVGLLKIRNFSALAEKMNDSSIGQMLQAGSVAPLVDSLYDNAEKQYEEASGDVDLSLEEIRSLPSGEITLAIIAPRREGLHYVVMMETEEDNEAVDKALGWYRDVMESSLEEGGDTDADAELKTEKNKFGVDIETMLVSGTRVYTCQHRGLLIACTSEDELEDMFVRWSGKEVDKVRALSENRKFITIAKRCAVSDDTLPDVRFFVDPISLFKASSRGDVAANVTIALLPTLGVDGVLARGGNVYVDHDQYEGIAHGHLLLASPREGLLNALAMKPDSYEPEPWVPVEIGKYVTTSWDVPQMLSSIKEISDKVMEGNYDEFFDSIQEQIEENGSDVNLQDDLIAHLTGRFSFVRPILSGDQLNGIGNVASVGISDVEKVEQSLSDIFGTDDLSQWWAEREYGAVKYWTKSEKSIQYQQDRVQARLDRRKKRAEKRGEELAPFGPRPEVRKKLPTFGVIGEHFVYSDSEEFFQNAVDAFNGDKPRLSDDEDFLERAATMTKMLKSDLPAAVFYSDDRREVEFYLKALTNENMMEVLDASLENNESGFYADLKASIDENGFPEAEDIAQYLSTSGGFITTDDSGYHFLFFQQKQDQE